jgi:hypothetical protein
MNLIGLAGVASSGKDTAAAVLVERFGFCRIALADEMKRICARLFHWSSDRLWGPSERRNEPDLSLGGLTARHALQQLGTNWGRAMHEDVWINLAISHARQVLDGERDWGFPNYTPSYGVTTNGQHPALGVVFSDVRFTNEVAAIHSVGGRVWRIDRPGAGLEGAAGAHVSETGIADLHVDGIIRNDRSLDDFQETVEQFAEIAGFKMVPR